MAQIPDYRALFDASPYPYLLIAPDKILIAANTAYLKAADTRADAIVGKHIFEAFPANPLDPDSTNLEEVARAIDIAIATKEPHVSPLLRYSVPEPGGDGERFSLRLWSAIHTPVLDDAGDVAFVAQTAIDVTDLYHFDAPSRHYVLKPSLEAVPDVVERTRPQLHEALTRILNAERTQLQDLFDQAPGFIAILDQADGAFTMVNDAFYRLVGRRQLIGVALDRAMPEWADGTLGKAVAEVCASGRALTLRGLQVPVQRVAGVAPVQRYLDLVLQPMPGAESPAGAIFLQGQDMTDAHLATRELTEKIQQLEAARARQATLLKLGDRLRGLEDDPDAMMAAGSEELASFLAVPRAGYVAFEDGSSQALVVHAYTDVARMPPLPAVVEEPDEYGRAIMEELRCGRPVMVDDLAVDPRSAGAVAEAHAAIGARATLAVPIQRAGRTVAFMFAHDDQPRGWSDGDIEMMAQTADRTWEAVERARAALALRDSDRRKDDFLAMLAHELRNPLAPIGAAAQLLQVARLDPMRLKQTSEVIGRQVRHMTGLIDDLLDVSRVTRGLISLHCTPLDLGEVVADAVEQVQPLMHARSHTLVLELAPRALIVNGDRKRLVQVVGNILNNAAKYTPDGGRIVLTTGAEAGQALVSIADNGIGMTPDLARRVFELFAQAERSSDRLSGGLGLGLALARSLVELHGGALTCWSAGPDAGSTFRTTLPLFQAAPDDAEPPVALADAAPAADAPLRILVVDDNVDAAGMLAMLLEAHGHQVEVEHGPVPALARAPIFRPDVCLLDIGLPGMDGYELARRLRAMPELAGVLLVAVTGYGQAEDRAAALEAGFDHHLVKPLDTRKLDALLAGVGK